ncbi:MAG: DUF4321 domain-containing protein [Candidatus Latescibacteria bacterium]|nr:DUF4321 domain-containing protein [Candidatus Latescibacterota bacterium]
MRRGIGIIILMIIVGAVVGSGLSFVLAKIFPSGPVYNLLCNVFSFGIPHFILNLGFISLSFGLTLSISGLTILFIILAVVLLIKF